MMNIDPQFLVIIAQVSIDASIDKFISFLGKILLVIALLMVVWAGFQIHDGRNREGAYALFGAFIVASAVVIVRYLFSLASW